MLADDLPNSPHISFAILDLEQNYLDLLSDEDKYDLAVCKQVGSNYTIHHFLRVQYLLDTCHKLRALEQQLRDYHKEMK